MRAACVLIPNLSTQGSLFLGFCLRDRHVPDFSVADAKRGPAIALTYQIQAASKVRLPAALLAAAHVVRPPFRVKLVHAQPLPESLDHE